MIIATVPVPAYLRKYALWRENLPTTGVLDLTSAGPIALLLGALLMGKAQADARGLDDMPDYGDHLSFWINDRRVDGTRRCFLSPENVRLFNTFLRNDLRRTLMDRLEADKKLNITEVDTIWSFMDELGIVDDISFDALKKGIYRTRKRAIKRKSRTFGNQCVPGACRA